MTEANGRAAILRAAGHHDAADLLDAIDKAHAPPDEVEQPRPTPEPPNKYAAAEAQRQAEGQVMLAALKRDIPDIFDRDR
jgi:hypothetical protein